MSKRLMSSEETGKKYSFKLLLTAVTKIIVDLWPHKMEKQLSNIFIVLIFVSFPLGKQAALAQSSILAFSV